MLRSRRASVPVVVLPGLAAVRAFLLDGTLLVAQAKTPAATARRVAAALRRLEQQPSNHPDR
jgi:hypothetical protein